MAENNLDFYPVIYCSEDNGLTWHYLATIASNPFGKTLISYPALLALSDGRILSTLGSCRGALWVCVSFSDDGGLTWSEPKRITRWGTSPYPVLLNDGRILIVYAWRETPPLGIRGKISDDGGKTWSEEFIIRGGGASGDLGYPVATQLDDGRIFVAYYFNVDDDVARGGKLGDFPGGRRFLAGTTFYLD
jgi:hypothetical protein